MLGRELQDLFPVAFLPQNHALAVAIMSYNGGMDFGLLGDYDALPDLEDFGAMVDDSLAELMDAAKKRALERQRRRRRAKPAAAAQARREAEVGTQ